MYKTRKNHKPIALQLEKETLVHLPADHVRDAAGGASNTTRLSQCPTLCF